MRSRLRAAAARGLTGLALMLTMVGCASTTATPPAGAGPAPGGGGRADVYAALGASETAGIGIDDQALRLRTAWPQLFFNTGLPRAATYYNFAIPGITTSDGLAVEVPAALATRPTVVTVLFGANDLIAGDPAASFEQDVGAVVRAMRQGGRAIVLIANLPPLDELPAVRACLAGALSSLSCSIGLPLTTLASLDARVAAYDAAVSRVAAREGATVVDLHGQAATLQAHPEYVSMDGFHPSVLGQAAIAAQFVAAYRAAAS